LRSFVSWQCRHGPRQLVRVIRGRRPGSDSRRRDKEVGLQVTGGTIEAGEQVTTKSAGQLEPAFVKEDAEPDNRIISSGRTPDSRRRPGRGIGQTSPPGGELRCKAQPVSRQGRRAGLGTHGPDRNTLTGPGYSTTPRLKQKLIGSNGRTNPLRHRLLCTDSPVGPHPTRASPGRRAIRVHSP
jgi:hypothetical protein